MSLPAPVYRGLQSQGGRLPRRGTGTVDHRVVGLSALLPGGPDKYRQHWNLVLSTELL